MLASVVIISVDSRQPPMCRHVPKISSPQLLLFRSLTNRDTRNSFRFRSCTNCRVPSFPPKKFSPSKSSLVPPCLYGWSVFRLPYTLPSSVSCNFFVCHSYENCRGVYQQFPFRNSSLGDQSSRGQLSRRTASDAGILRGDCRG